MSKKSNIVHLYFKKEIGGSKIYVKLDPVHLSGIELTINADGARETREMQFDEAIYEDLKMDSFVAVNGMEFNLILSGLAN
ncbi:MAG: hypothetical protein RLN86_12465 [Cyclobacteriaceae bacterium]